MNIIIVSALVLGATGLLAAIILYVVAKRFAVVEDERIEKVEALLAGANCGACGMSGCHAFATECVKRGVLGELYCPVSGADSMKKIAALLGTESPDILARVAVLRCAGSCSTRHRVTQYSGVRKCSLINAVETGEYSCRFGCLGCGDCMEACVFDAISMDMEAGHPVITTKNCTGCGKCVSVCPKNLLTLMPKRPQCRRVWVACSNTDRGAVARKDCSAACIGCGKCVKACPFGAITMQGSLAVIDGSKCRLCRKCVAECPVGAIHTSGFPEKEVSMQNNISAI